jgi:hypothetical protein
MQMSCDDVAGGAWRTPSCRSTAWPVANHLALSCRVIASASPAREQSTARCCTVACYYSGVPTHLTGHDYATHPRILQVPWYTQALLSNMSILTFSHYNQILLYWFLSDSHGTHGGTRALPSGKAGSRAVGRVAALEPSRVERRGPQLRDAWRHQSPPKQRGGVWSCKTQGATGALPNGAARPSTVIHTAALGHAPCFLP